MLNFGPSGGAVPSGTQISELAITGNSSSGNGISIKQCENIWLRRLNLDMHAGFGVLFNNVYGVQVDSVAATRCGASGSSSACGGIGWVNTAGANNGHQLMNCTAEYCKGHGVLQRAALAAGGY